MPAGASATDTYGPIEKGETLSKIAGQVKPADVSLEQMLVALYRENQGAFSGKNMNRLKTGQILKIPSAEDIGKIEQKDARAEIHTQVQDWNSYREQLAGGVAASPTRGESTASSNTASGRVTSAAVAPPPSPTSAPSDTLRLSRTESASGKGAAGKAGNVSQERLNSLQEELTSKNKALQESQSRVADLEKQIRDMQRLLDLKGSAATKPGTQVAVVPPPPVTAPPVTPPVTPPAVTPPAVTPAQAGAQSPAKPAEPPKVAEATPPKVAEATPTPPKTETPPTEAAKPAAPKKPPPRKVVPPPPPQKGFVDELMENPAYLAGGVGVIALLAIAGFIVARRRRSGGNDMGANSQMTSAFPSDLKPGANTSKPAAGLVDTGNSSFLTDFDKTGPGTIDTDEVDPVAEAEVYIAYGRDAQAEEILKEAMARDKSRHEIALKLLEIYHARKSATAFETVAKELRNAVGEGSPLWTKAAAMGAQIDPSNPLYGSAAAGTATFTAMSPTAPAPAPKPDLDFDLEGGRGAASAPAPSFDLDLDAQRHAEPASHAPASGLDFDLAPTGGAAPRMDVPAEAAREEKPAFDFDLSGLDMGGSKPAPAASQAPASSGGGMDFADINLEATASGAGGEAVGTKLELAKAYLEIGDKDGAREILHEVAKEGSSAQKDEAKKLIASL
jgi:pilus assembly protein FimV